MDKKSDPNVPQTTLTQSVENKMKLPKSKQAPNSTHHPTTTHQRERKKQANTDMKEKKTPTSERSTAPQLQHHNTDQTTKQWALNTSHAVETKKYTPIDEEATVTLF